MIPMRHNRRVPSKSLFFIAALLFCAPLASQQPAAVGVFDGHGDIGTLLTPGSASEESGTYTINASGENMWAAADALHFVWKKVAGGDVSLAADIAFATTTGNAHKKGVLMIRQSLDADSAYCDAALHLDGLTSLQCRERKGGPTYEIRQAILSPTKRLRLEKRGADFYVSTAGAGEDLHFSGGSARVPFEGAFYVGIGVCAHDKNAVERVLFSNVAIASPEAAVLHSTVEIAPIRGDRRAIYTSMDRMKSATWSADGKSVVFLSGDKTLSVLATGGVAASAVVDKPKTSLFVAKRRGRMQIYRQTAGGGGKAWLTKSAGNNENPVLSADGASILFDSDRSGTRQVWRMALDGSKQEQLTDDGMRNWQPHLSPDGTRVAMLSSSGAAGDQMQLRVLTLADKKIAVLASVEGGAMDAGPWSPDSRMLVFVSFQGLPR